MIDDYIVSILLISTGVTIILLIIGGFALQRQIDKIKESVNGSMNPNRKLGDDYERSE